MRQSEKEDAASIMLFDVYFSWRSSLQLSAFFSRLVLWLVDTLINGTANN